MNNIIFGIKGEENKQFKFYGKLNKKFGNYPSGDPEITENGESHNVEECYINTKNNKFMKAKLFWWKDLDGNICGLICDKNDDNYWPTEHMLHFDDINSI